MIISNATTKIKKKRREKRARGRNASEPRRGRFFISAFILDRPLVRARHNAIWEGNVLKPPGGGFKLPPRRRPFRPRAGVYPGNALSTGFIESTARNIMRREPIPASRDRI